MGTVALAGVVLVALTRVLPDEKPMDDLNATCLQFSQDGGEYWGDVGEVAADDRVRPVPGGEYVHAAFLARNACDVPATLQVYAGRWHVSDAATGTWRAELAGTAGEPTDLTGPARQSDWGVLLAETAAPQGRVIPVRLLLGIPDAEVTQDYSITPGWALALEDTTAVIEPADDRVPMGRLVHLDGPTTHTGPR